MYRNDGETMTIAEQLGYGSEVSTEEALARSKEHLDEWMWDFYEEEIVAGRMTVEEALAEAEKDGLA